MNRTSPCRAQRPASAEIAGQGEGFRTLTVTVPCCGVATSLNALVYDWPMGFARFRIETRHPNRARLTGEELAALTDALGHPLRQILTHI
ncbi:hypothetical protein AB0A98_22380 [Streptomyces chrestomyceticus]|uniref:hypothetical protein n=1 Tax=Streptomyces chrestomyceticus TaxID=68185 RepID=UPI0033C4F53D